MNSLLTVSTECPTCGAPLDFSEGSNAIRCLHCRSHLLVTGRKQLLSYAILPKIDENGAVKRIRLVEQDSHTPPRLVKAQLYFVPYYRLTGHDFLWEKTDPPSTPESQGGVSPLGQQHAFSDLDAEVPFGRSSLSKGIIQIAIHLFDLFFGNKKAPLPPLSLPTGALQGASMPAGGAALEKKKPVRDEEIAFRDRYVEKNFLASDLDGLGLYSLGVRPAVLSLALFQRVSLEKQGKIVGVALSPDAAFAHGMKAADSQKILYRQVIGQILSVVYFPFWVVEMEKRGEGCLKIVDAVSERVIQLDAPLSTYERLDQSSAGEREVVGFRPLTCPNCGWDLPAKPEDVIFVCPSCEKGWQIRGRYLYETAYTIAAGGASAGALKYLPFWVLEIQIGTDRSHRYFVPAFRYRRLKMLSDLARNLSRKQPAYSPLDGKKPELHGCYYDQEDAAKLAQFIHAGSDKKSLEEADLEKMPLHVKNATLTWFPFEEKAGGLLDPFTGFSLPKNLLM